MEKGRNYGIDLLRLVLMYMVCILHTLGQGGILQASVAGTVGYNTYWFLEILSYCAVDGFAIISGYMAVNKPKRYEKLVEMWFQVFFYSFIVTVILTVAGINNGWTPIDMVKCFFPVTFGKYWYFTAYFCCFLAMPILNKFLFSVKESTAKKAFIVIIIMFSVMERLGKTFNTQGGYSAIWLIVLYCIGVLAKRIKLFEKRSNFTLVTLWLFCILATWAVYIFIGSTALVSYVSPTILLSGLIMVVLFSRIKINGKIISKLSPLAFGIYLFQLNPVIWNNVLKDMFKFVTELSLPIGVVYVFFFSLLIFLSGLVIEFIRSKVAKKIKIPLLSEKIVSIINTILSKAFVFLR